MKAKSIQYTIQNPCDESWNDMTPESSGRFCGSCQKSVVDFTVMSDFSIVNYLENHKHEKVCGRFTKPQLNRVYSLNQPVFAPTFDLRAVVLGLALTTFCAIHSFGQTEPREPVKPDTTLLMDPTSFFMGKVALDHYDHRNDKMISGVVHLSKNDFKLVDVQFKNSKGEVLKSIHPDANGQFSMDLNWKLNPVFISVSGAGYETWEQELSKIPVLSDLQITLHDQIELIRGEVIQGDVKAADGPEEDQILQKIEMGNVSIEQK